MKLLAIKFLPTSDLTIISMVRAAHLEWLVSSNCSSSSKHLFQNLRLGHPSNPFHYQMWGCVMQLQSCAQYY